MYEVEQKNAREIEKLKNVYENQIAEFEQQMVRSAFMMNCQRNSLPPLLLLYQSGMNSEESQITILKERAFMLL